MPLTEKGTKIKRAMTKTYGSEKGKRIFYASANKGTITGVHRAKRKHGSSHYSKSHLAMNYATGNPAEKLSQHWEAEPEKPHRPVFRRSIAASKRFAKQTEREGVAIDPASRLPAPGSKAKGGTGAVIMGADLSPLMQKAEQGGKLPPRIE